MGMGMNDSPDTTDRSFFSRQLTCEIDRLSFLKTTAFFLGGSLFASPALFCTEKNRAGSFQHISQTQADLINAFATGLAGISEEQSELFRVDQNLDRIISMLPPALGSQASLALYAMEYAPLIFFRGWTRFSRLSLQEREKLVREMMFSSSDFQRSLVHLLKSLAIFSLYQHPKFIQQTGITALRRCP